jgi:hypothetical protein
VAFFFLKVTEDNSHTSFLSLSPPLRLPFYSSSFPSLHSLSTPTQLFFPIACVCHVRVRGVCSVCLGVVCVWCVYAVCLLCVCVVCVVCVCVLGGTGLHGVMPFRFNGHTSPLSASHNIAWVPCIARRWAATWSITAEERGGRGGGSRKGKEQGGG